MARRYGTSGGATFRVEGIEPTDLSGHPEAVRRMYWRWIVELTLTAKDRELAAGLDRFGMMLVPIAAKTRRYRRSVKGPADPNAPPLQPAHELSRTRSLFRGRAFPDRAEFYWAFDEFSGASWGRILKFHARGRGHLPVRDVIGLSPQSTQWVRAQALGRWGTWLHARQTAPGYRPEKKTAPTPKGWQVGQTKAKEVPKIELTGHTNLDNYTFGIGASKDEVRRMIESGHFTGFRQLHTFKPGTGPSAGPKPKPAPKPKPKPAKPAPSPPPTFEAELETKLKTITSKYERLAEIEELVSRHAVDAGEYRDPTLANPETVKAVEYAGTKWHFTEQAKGGLYGSLDTIFLARDRIPERLSTATKRVYFTAQENRQDEYWRRTYKGFTRSHAAGGGGEVVVFHSDSLSVGSFTHESGHNLASNIYGDTDPTCKPGSDYAAIVAKAAEPPVSDYGKNSPSEDFAEACREYVEDRSRLRDSFPERFRVIHKLMTDPSYGG